MARFNPLSRVADALSIRSANSSRNNVAATDPASANAVTTDGHHNHPNGHAHGHSRENSKDHRRSTFSPSRIGFTSDSARTSTESARGRREQKRKEKLERQERLEHEKLEIEERRKREEEHARQTEDPETLARYGKGDETDVHPMELLTIEQAAKLPLGTEVTFRCRIQHQRRLSEALDFLLFRDQTHTIQGVLSRASPHMVKWVQRLHSESLVEVHGTLQKPVSPVKSALHSDVEVDIYSIHLLSAATNLPGWDNYHAPTALNQRMADRLLDLRHPSNQALFRIRAMVTRTFREHLQDRGFVEIQTPKLQPAATESGAEVFKVQYFGRRAFLAQSPQLAKQMTVSADFKRVMEIGPVFRAENSNTHRHLTEYTGLDIEMALTSDYHELMMMVDGTLKAIFKAMYSMPEVEIVRQRWPSGPLVWLDETLVLKFPEAVQMLRDDGRDVELEEDFGTRDEIRLGELVKEKYHTDYFILDKFPTAVRPFYTHKDADDERFTNSFDIFVRGQEICTGGQRIHDPKELRRSMAKAGISEDGMEEYLLAFDHGAPPHGGAGLGLERILAWALELGDVRYASLYPRDPKSLPTKPPSLPHPEADTTKPRLPNQPMPSIEDLIANYGDATNTSWLDERFEIWRHRSGGAVGYVLRGDKFAMMTGDPLVDRSQYHEVITEFVHFVKNELKRTPIWMLVSAPVQAVLGSEFGWRTLTCAEEQRVDADRHALPKDHAQDQRRVEREGIKIHEVKPDERFIVRADKAIEEWKAARTSRHKQIHLTEVRPWVDMAHRRYFAAEKEDKVCSLVVLARLAPRYGWQVKWALDFPGAPNGAIEVLIDRALSSVSGPVTFGIGASEKLRPGAHLHGVRATFLAKTYDVVAKSLKLGRKSEFRLKFGAYGEPMYICYPRWGVTVTDLHEIVKFFED